MSPASLQPDTLASPADASVLSALARLAGLLLPAWQRRRALAACGGFDAATGLANERGLALLGEPLLGKARAAGRPFALVVLDFEELAEMPALYGATTAQRVLERVVRRMRDVAGPAGVALRTGRGQFAVLLPGLNQQAARDQVQRVLGRPSRVEFEMGRAEIVLVPEVAAEQVARDGESVLDVYRELAAGLAQQRHDERRRRSWLRRERERHSRPGLLP